MQRWAQGGGLGSLQDNCSTWPRDAAPCRDARLLPAALSLGTPDARAMKLRTKTVRRPRENSKPAHSAGQGRQAKPAAPPGAAPKPLQQRQGRAPPPAAGGGERERRSPTLKSTAEAQAALPQLRTAVQQQQSDQHCGGQLQQPQPGAPEPRRPAPTSSADGEAARWLAAHGLSPLLDLGLLRSGLESAGWGSGAGAGQVAAPPTASAPLTSLPSAGATPLSQRNTAVLPSPAYLDFGSPLVPPKQPVWGTQPAAQPGGAAEAAAAPATTQAAAAAAAPPRITSQPAAGAAEVPGSAAAPEGAAAAPLGPLVPTQAPVQPPSGGPVLPDTALYAAAADVPFQIPTVRFPPPAHRPSGRPAVAAAASAAPGFPRAAPAAYEPSPASAQTRFLPPGSAASSGPPSSQESLGRSQRVRRQRVQPVQHHWSDEEEEGEAPADSDSDATWVLGRWEGCGHQAGTKGASQGRHALPLTHAEPHLPPAPHTAAA